jgi:hypothetical protein
MRLTEERYLIEMFRSKLSAQPKSTLCESAISSIFRIMGFLLQSALFEMQQTVPLPNL